MHAESVSSGEIESHHFYSFSFARFTWRWSRRRGGGLAEHGLRRRRRRRRRRGDIDGDYNSSPPQPARRDFAGAQRAMS